MRLLPILPIALLLTSSIVFDSVIDTKHNLSNGASTATRTVKATTEEEVCVFCHIPHQAQEGRPLWNRQMPTADYQMYNSDYLRRMNYPTPTNLGKLNGEPGALSRQCLSCHDGTIAVGSVYLVRGTVMGTDKIVMSGVDPDGTLQDAAATMFGTNLTSHHPVGIEYNHAITKNFSVGSRGMELLATPGTAIKLYTFNNKQYVECSSCHDPHTQTAKFLRYSSGGSLGANVYGTCTSCHAKTGWTAGAHATFTNTYTDTAVNTTYGTNTVSSLGCVNCHKPHKGAGQPYLLRKVEQNTCFEGAGSGTTSTVPCHGVGGAKDVQTSFLRTYGHPTLNPATDAKHTNLDVLYGASAVGENGVSWATNKHAECTDCHNPHQAKAGNHTDPPDLVNTMFPATPTNLISKSGPLTGVTGVEPTWISKIGWRIADGYNTLETAEKEYQVCMKCHSSWALGNTVTPVSNHLIGGRAGDYATDQAWEFNPVNKSAHPVVMSHEAMKVYGGNTLKNPAAEGRYADSLTTTSLKSPWVNTPGNNTMYCSDCHGADEQTTDPRGPHGSSYKYMLKGRGNYWPYKPDGVTLWDIDSTTVDAPDLFCQNCHKTETVGVHVFKSDRNRFVNMVCVNCHSGIPHGSKVSRLMAYNTMPHPYNFNGNSKIQGFRALGASNYVTTFRGRGNVWTSDTGTCRCHGSAVGGAYDVYP